MAKEWPPLDQLLGVDGHVVPQVVKAELVVGAVGDVGGVGVLLGLSHHPVDDQAHGEAHEAVHLAHPLAVALGQVVVDGDDVHALAGQGVQVGGRVATRVLPSPVFISAMRPWCRMMPPMICTG